MKKLKLLLLLSISILSANAQEEELAKKISISFANTTLREGLNKIENAAGLTFAFNNDMPELTQLVNLSYENTKVSAVLEDLLAKFGLKYKVSAGQIVVYKERKKGSGKIRGSIVDAETGESLAFVNVMLDGLLIGTITDGQGNFSIDNIADGDFTIVTSYLGYENSRIENIELRNGEIISVGKIELKGSGVTLNSVTVTPGSFSIMGSMPTSYQTIEKKDLKIMSFSEDVTRAVSRLPGISSNDYSSKFTVRGGEANEVLINLDGMELYEPFHQRDFAGGLFSIVDIETVQGIDLLTGGFGAEYGNRQSGVFNMKTNNVSNSQTSIGLSIMNARVYTDSRFAQNKGSYMFSIRRGMLDQTFKLIGEEENTPKFYDGLAKIEYNLGKKNILSFHTLISGDKTEVRDIAPEGKDVHDTQYNNSYSWFTLKSFVNNKTYARSLLYGGYITHERNGNTAKYELSDKLNFKLEDVRNYIFYGFKQDWQIDFSKNLHIKTGFDLRQLEADYTYNYRIQDVRINSQDTIVPFRDSADIKIKPSGQQYAVYLSSKFRISPKLFFETGVRYDCVTYTDDKVFSPRVSAAYSLSENTIARVAWGRYYQSQFINDLDVNHKSEEFDEAELSTHYVVGVEHNFRNGLSMRIEGYYKDISNLSPTFQNLRDPWEVFPESRNDIAKLNFDGASAMGLELFLKYDMSRKISWWFSYSLAESKENITSIEFEGLLVERVGNLPRINNQKHSIYCDLIYRANEKWHFNLSWQYYEGWPLTIYNYDFQELANGDLHFYQRHGEFRGKSFPDYHRMDVRINRYFYQPNCKWSAYLHVVNVYNRENLRKFDLDVRDDNENLVPDGNGGYQYFRDDKNWFGITPVVGVSLEF